MFVQTHAPFFGARLTQQGTSFRLWAPKAQMAEVVFESQPGLTPQPLRRDPQGFFTGEANGTREGTLYSFLLNGRQRIPDPASRSQPYGVHGPSEVTDLEHFSWTDGTWRGQPLNSLVIYEIHVGAFSEEGSFRGVEEKLPHLAELGVTAIELMPVAEFPGERNWGYDGVFPNAPSHIYGRPKDLQRLVNTAHELGIAVLLDVVYNHFGPDGNYWQACTDTLETQRYKTPWGAAFNFDGPGSAPVREFFIQNALQWLQLYHFDGLRFDATHAIFDSSAYPIMAELTDRCRSTISDREIILIAENEERDKKFFTPSYKGGWGMDAVWADDFHHQLRRRFAGDQEGYFQDFTGSVPDIGRTVRNGWSIPSQARVSDPLTRFVFCLQNHDQVGNRAYGERLHHEITPAAFRAASTLLLLAAETPLLFMGQEWAASSPFLYFTDHEKSLGEKVVAGRREEFKSFRAFSDPEARARIPSPQDRKTFLRSRLNWPERNTAEHALTLNLYKTLLLLRQNIASLYQPTRTDFSVDSLHDSILVLVRRREGGPSIVVVVNLGKVEKVNLSTVPSLKNDAEKGWAAWGELLSTESPLYASDPQPMTLSQSSHGQLILNFARPGVAVFRV